MKLIFYLLMISQMVVLIGANADKLKSKKDEIKSLKWEKIEKNENNQRTLMWKSYNDNESYFLDNNNFKENIKSELEDEIPSHRNYWNQKNVNTNINPLIPTNYFLNEGDFQTQIHWKSSFDGGASRGTGQQNPLFLIDYGISEKALLSFYFSEANDILYNLIEGKEIPYYWQSYAISYKRKVFEHEESNTAISFVSTLEYLRTSSGSKNSKSIFNETDNISGKQNSENIVGAFSLPLSKEINKKATFLLVPGITFLPEKIGSKNIGKNSYGNNFYIGTGFIFDLSKDLKLLASYTNPLGPGSNYFDSNLKYSNKSIYSYGLKWDVNNRIGLEGVITNSYGSSPSTGLLTIPSDNKTLYSANLIYRPYGEDTYLKPLNTRDILVSHGGMTVNNALIQDIGKVQGGINYDLNGNIFFSYRYSLSNVFQLEFIDIGKFHDINASKRNSSLRNTYVDKDNLNFRLGGKLLLFSPQKDDLLWTSVRTSVGRNDNTNQGYIYSELMNTFRLNNSIAINITPKYFYSGVESFGAIGISKYINLNDNLQLIPEINSMLKEESEFNSTIALRYAYKPSRSIDIYFSNSVGLQDLGQILKGDERFGIRLNFVY